MSVGNLTPEQFAAYAAAIRLRESSNRYYTTGGDLDGYAGAYQMGAAALEDVGLIKTGASKTGTSARVINNPDNWTITGGLNSFLNNPELQDQKFLEYTQRNYSTLGRLGVVNSSSSQAEISAYLAVSHLLGPGGARDYRNGTAGRDAFGTDATEYFNIGANALNVNPDTIRPIREISDQDIYSADGQSRIPIPPGSTPVIGPQGNVVGFDFGNDDIRTIEEVYGPGGTHVGADSQEHQRNRSGAGSTGYFTESLNITIDPQPNFLGEYDSYTYNIALYMLRPHDYIRMMQISSIGGIPKTLLMKSGGIGNRTSENFDVDFYIDNVKIKNIATSPSRASYNTNVIDIQFDITEPRGCTLIERLLAQSRVSLGPTESFLQTPYLLEITFTGYNDVGTPSIVPIAPKYIPIKFTELKFDVTSSGTVYQARAIPYNHSVFSTVNNTIPLQVQIHAKTIGNIFSNNVRIITADQQRIEAQAYGGLTPDQFDFTNRETQPPITDANSTDLAGAINSFNQQLTQPRMVRGQQVPSSTEIADEIEFAVADEIAAATIIGEYFDPENTPTEKSQFRQYADNLLGQVSLTTENNVFRINAGTNIINLINALIIYSDYIEQNIIDVLSGESTEELDGNTPIKWFKVKPKITEILGWDAKTGAYKYRIRYDIVPAVIFYRDFPWASKAGPGGIGYHKIYDYIFTGKNTEVLDFKLNFNVAYYSISTINTGIPFADKDPENIHNTPNFQQIISPEGHTVTDTSRGADTSPKRARARDLFTSIMHDGHDLIDLRMSIAGDPAFIPTGDNFWQADELNKRLYTGAYMPDGTINYDISQPFIKINLKTPVDYNDQVGLQIPTGQYLQSEFAGIYVLTEIETEFTNGQMTHTLRGYRARTQTNAKTDTQEDRVILSRDTGLVPGSGEMLIPQVGSTSRLRVIGSGEGTIEESELPPIPDGTRTVQSPPSSSVISSVAEEEAARIMSQSSRPGFEIKEDGRIGLVDDDLKDN